MELRQPRSTITSVERGVPSERKFIGMFYVATGKAHVSLMDSCIQVETARVPVVEQDGVLLAVESSEDRYDQTVELCQKCAPLGELDFSWHEDAACYNTQVDFFFDKATASDGIEQYCNNCPVIRECLETGALLDKQNAGTVWGGIYFPRDRSARLRAIEEKRQELARA